MKTLAFPPTLLKHIGDLVGRKGAEHDRPKLEVGVEEIGGEEYDADGAAGRQHGQQDRLADGLAGLDHALLPQVEALGLEIGLIVDGQHDDGEDTAGGAPHA